MKFKRILMQSIQHNVTKYSWQKHFQLLIIILGLIGYCLPVWKVAFVGLNFNAFDLAEWSTLHPSVQFTSIPLVPALAFRIGLIGFISLLHLELLAIGVLGPVYWLIAALAGIAMLPPIEALNHLSIDLNYRQQLSLSLATWIGLGICYVFKLGKNIWIRKVIVVVTAVSYITGIFTSKDLFTEIQVTVDSGIGLYVVATSIACLSFSKRVEDKFPYPQITL